MKEDANVFIVDWSVLSSKFDYVRVAHSINLIGMEIANFIYSLDISNENIHCIGHSLGLLFFIKKLLFSISILIT